MYFNICIGVMWIMTGEHSNAYCVLGIRQHEA